MEVVESPHTGTFSDLFMEKGYEVRYYRHRLITKGGAHSIIHDIKQGAHPFVVVEAPIPGWHVPQPMLSKCWNTICTWARVAHDVDTPMVIIGPKGSSWDHEYLTALVRDKVVYITRHRACRFGVSVLGEHPSEYTTIAATTRPANGSPCKCGLRVKHVKDYKAPAENTTGETPANTQRQANILNT